MSETATLTASVTYQEESFDEVYPEVEDMLKAHWHEIAQDQDKMPLDVNVEAYRNLERAGGLSIVTMRVHGVIGGYFVSFLHYPLHYQSTLCAEVDIYYVKPEYRHQALGLNLFWQAEHFLKARGVKKVFAGTKVYQDASALFRGLRWTETETLFTKWIGD